MSAPIAAWAAGAQPSAVDKQNPRAVQVVHPCSRRITSLALGGDVCQHCRRKFIEVGGGVTVRTDPGFFARAHPQVLCFVGALRPIPSLFINLCLRVIWVRVKVTRSQRKTQTLHKRQGPHALTLKAPNPKP